MVREPLSAHTFDRRNGAILVIEAKLGAVIVAMVIFGQIPMQRPGDDFRLDFGILCLPRS
jgi:hypothetical protein